MANASVRMLTLGWTGAQRRALMAVLDDKQRQMVRGRIEMESLNKTIDEMEAADAIQFLESKGQSGYSCGIPEWASAVLFGRDPAFREMWQIIRRCTDEVTPEAIEAARKQLDAESEAA